MFALYKKELQSYFLSPAAYVVLAFFTLTFSLTMIMGISGASANLYEFSFSSIFYSNLFYLIFTLPLLTMRSFSEERKNGTEVMLLSSPVSVTKIVLAKFLATSTIFLIMMLVVMFHPIVTAINGKIILSRLICTFIGFYLCGLVYIALGILISSFTESILLSIVLSEALILLLILVDNLSNFSLFSSAPILSDLFDWLSNQKKFYTFSRGLFRVSDLIGYITEIFVFVIWTIISVEKRRWSRR
ncbi:MAG: ABC transporter permease [Ruminococcus sp.]|nr:ABC transporter permease [Ruminococcus sp.]